jgi:protein associated with RNAse G/E
MSGYGYDFIMEDRVPVVVYDVSIVDMEERKKKAKYYETMKKTCQVLQVSQKSLHAAIKNRGRVFSPALQKEVAVRYKKQST